MGAGAGSREGGLGEGEASWSAFRRAEKSYALRHVERRRGRRTRLMPVPTRMLHEAPREGAAALVDFDAVKAPEGVLSTVAPCGQRVCSLAGVEGVCVLPAALDVVEERRMAAQALSGWLSPQVSRTNLLDVQRDAWYMAMHGECAPWVVVSGAGGAQIAGEATKKRGRLRWATLGRQFEWNTRNYVNSEEATSEASAGGRPPLPEELAALGERCAAIAVATGALPPHRQPEYDAAIVNYYNQPSDTLCGHTDDTEMDLDVPLVSISLGAPCVFLLGGDTVDEAPRALLLRGRDVLLMAGAARRRYHAVPRILSCDENIEGEENARVGRRLRERKGDLRGDGSARSGEAGDAIDKWLARSRININLRDSSE